jgi:hypothetical protein
MVGPDRRARCEKERHAALVYDCSAAILVFGLYLLVERTWFA